MKLFIKPSHPPLVITSAFDFTVCGSGHEARDWLTPRVMCRSTGFVVYNNGCRLLRRYRGDFVRQGYRIRIFDTANLKNSVKYNPFSYVKNGCGIPKLVSAIVTGTKGYGKPGDMRFHIAETLLLTALFSYVAEETPEEERNIFSVTEMLRYMLPDEGYPCDYYDQGYKHAVDYMFEEKGKEDPLNKAVYRYNDFNWIAGALKSKVIKSCAARLEPFTTEESKEFFSNDELQMDRLCDSKIALFVSSGKSDTLDFIVTLMYSQLFDILYEQNANY